MIEIHCDESRPELFHSKNKKNTNDKYLILGGIWVNKKEKERTKLIIKQLRNQYNVYGEIKWKNVSPNKLDFYLAIIDHFFKSKELRFRCIVVDSEKVDLDKYHESDAELGYYKFYYQLLHHWIEPDETYAIFLDYKKNKRHDRLKVLHTVLKNANLWSDIVNVQGISSKDSVFIQIADVLMGAVGYKYNKYSSSLAKSSLVKHIEYFLHRPIGKTSAHEKKFNVFQIDLG